MKIQFYSEGLPAFTGLNSIRVALLERAQKQKKKKPGLRTIKVRMKNETLCQAMRRCLASHIELICFGGAGSPLRQPPVEPKRTPSPKPCAPYFSSLFFSLFFVETNHTGAASFVCNVCICSHLLLLYSPRPWHKNL